MKRFLSVMLSVFIIASMLTVGVSAADGDFADDEWNGKDCGFTAEVFDGAGRRAVKTGYNVTMEEYIKGYNGMQDDTVGMHLLPWTDSNGTKYGEEGNVNDSYYTVLGKDTRFTVDWKNKEGMRVGGCWSSPARKNLPFNKMPLNFDVDLNGKKEISGTRIYVETDVAYVKECEIYVKFNGEADSWHYVCTTSNTEETAKDLTADFGCNVMATHLRVSVTKASLVTPSEYKSSDGTLSIPAGAVCYIYMQRIAVLKSKDAYPAAYDEPEHDDEIIIDPANITGYYQDKKDDSSKKLMDGNFFNSAILNGKAAVDFGKTVEFSGIRYYPPKNGTSSTVVGNFGGWRNGTTPVNRPDFIQLFDSSKVNGNTVTYNNLRTAGVPYANVVYPTVDGVTYYTGAVTVDFGKNVTAGGLYLHIFNSVDSIANGTVTTPYAGEIRLIKPKDYSHGYALKDDVLKLSNTPKVIDKGASLSTAILQFKNPGALFDEVIYMNTDEHDPGDYNSFAAFEYANFKDGETSYLTIDLGAETELSAVRLFGRMKFGMAPTKTNLYFSDDNVNWSKASYNEDSNTGWTQNMPKYSKSNDIYTDLKPNDGKTDYSVRTRYVKLEILESMGSNEHAAISEIMLVKPGADVKTITELNNAILKNSVEFSIKEAQSGVLKSDGKGIIRFITKFTKIDSEVEYFGTYVIRQDKASFGETSEMSDNTACYTVGKDGVTAPSAGNTYSVDITGIEDKYFDVPVYAVSFVKIKGYDNLILSEVKKDVTVNKNMNLKTAVTAEDGE